MAVNVGWDAKYPARGSYYSRWKDKFGVKNSSNIEWVSKHDGHVYQNVVLRNGQWVGVGLVGLEPKYANRYSSDRKIRYIPKPRPFKVKTIFVGKKKAVEFKKPVTIFQR
mgnify:CR=1 FL=1